MAEQSLSAQTPNPPIFRNRIVDKKQLKKLIAWTFSNYGTARTAQVADSLKNLGFRYATRAGVSISVEDLRVPEVKRQMLDSAEGEIRNTEERYTRGEITEVERFQKVIDTWAMTNEELTEQVVTNFRQSDPLNSVYMMAFSGARGNISQVRQLVGMRGLMANPQGEIIDLPIKTNFREGLTVTEYIISSYGARKGLVDTALRTADSGYLTRRLVDVSQDVIVREHDCGTQRSITLGDMTDGDRKLIDLGDRLLGRSVAEDVLHPETGEVIVARNQQISAELASEISTSGVKQLKVRSPLTCEAARSVCQLCYGWSLAHSHLVDMGEAVGIIAAQSIGEPGTQLTMRTFHTGGVFTGEVARSVRAKTAGKVTFSKRARTRPFRTRHGDEALTAEANFNLELTEGKTTQKIPIAQGSTIFARDGATVAAGQMVAEIPVQGRARRSTERATKDVATDLAGEVKFADIVPEEKRDRQGNITRIAQRGGLIWVLSGEVYNLPPGAEPTVQNGDRIKEGDVIAATHIVSEQGGIVRLPDETEGNREVEIITASVMLDQAQVREEKAQGREHYVIETSNSQRFNLTATPGTKVTNGQVVAELISDQYRTQTGGILKFADIEVSKQRKAKMGYEVNKGGTLLWIPEEAHEVNKDISLLMVEDGQYVEAGTEVVKDIFCQSSGVVEVTQKNDILREIVIKPGDLHLMDNPDEVVVASGAIANPGQDIMPGLTAEVLRYVEYVETPEGSAVLLRPVVEYVVPDEPPIPSQDSMNEETAIRLHAVQRLPFKDGERVKSIEGVDLVRTQLVLEIENGPHQLTADIELIPDEQDEELLRLQLVILESFVIRRDVVADTVQGSTKTRLLVEDRQQIDAGAIVARTEILCKEPGLIRGIREGEESIRRILTVREDDMFTVDLQGQAATIGGDELLVAGAELATGITLPESGQVLEVKGDSVLLRLARPYRISNGAVLHVDDGSLVQRGDNLVILVFERAKTGDIIQGLPRIEELLEARKPKEACLLAKRPGVAQVVYGEDEQVEIKVIEDDGTISEYETSLGQNVIVLDGQKVETAQRLTDGPANPHDILKFNFEYQREVGGGDSQANYHACLSALREVQTFLVNEVQSVYQSQGIDISDKHIEVIVRQMTSKGRIEDGGDTTMLPGELVELRQVDQVNEAMSITGGAPADYEPVLLGITKASLNTDSFISAASFQETTRVLTEAAIEGKSDWLRGLKENVIIGRLIPAGTGFNAYEESIAAVNDSDLAYDGSAMMLGDNAAIEDIVLDDQTARSYGFEADSESNATLNNPMILDDELIDDNSTLG